MSELSDFHLRIRQSVENSRYRQSSLAGAFTLCDPIQAGFYECFINTFSPLSTFLVETPSPLSLQICPKSICLRTTLDCLIRSIALRSRLYLYSVDIPLQALYHQMHSTRELPSLQNCQVSSSCSSAARVRCSMHLSCAAQRLTTW